MKFSTLLLIVLFALGCTPSSRAATFTPLDPLTTSDWYVDSATGNDGNDCLSWPTACQSFTEPFVRFSSSVPTTLTYTTVHLRGDFSDVSPSVSPPHGLVVTVLGERTHLGTYALSTYVPWSSSSAQEGRATVTGFDASTYSSANGYGLEVGPGGSTPGLGVLVGLDLGGSFVTAGGALPGDYTPREPAAGDPLRLYQLTKVATMAGTSFTVFGSGLTVVDLEIGSGADSVDLSPDPGPWNGVEADAAVIHGVDSYGEFFTHGTKVTDGLNLYAESWSLDALDVDAVAAYGGGGTFTTGDHVIVGTGGVWIGRENGPAFALFYGAVAVLNYAAPCLHLDAESVVSVDSAADANVWCRDSVGTAPAAVLDPGAQVLYAPGHVPRAVGAAAPAPWVLAGGIFATLPAENGSTRIEPTP